MKTEEIQRPDGTLYFRFHQLDSAVRVDMTYDNTDEFDLYLACQHLIGILPSPALLAIRKDLDQTMREKSKIAVTSMN